MRVRAGLAKQIELDGALGDLDQLDAELRGVEVTLDELSSTHRVIGMELAEQLARQRVKVGAELTAEAKRAIIAISEGLAALQRTWPSCARSIRPCGSSSGPCPSTATRSITARKSGARRQLFHEGLPLRV